jgi:hypothetical protein
MVYIVQKSAVTGLFIGALVAAFAQGARAQTLPPTILQIDVDNSVQYVEDSFDVSKFATNPNITPATLVPAFANVTAISDIVAVNGQPARGTFSYFYRRLNLTTASASGQAIADTTRQNLINQVYEIQSADGTSIGTIMCQGLGGTGAPPPGAPSTQVQGNLTITGGTGMFAGVRGSCGGGTAPNPVTTRVASIVEDPSFRRKNGGGRNRQVLSINPPSSALPTVTGLTVSAATVKLGGSFSATVTGTNLTDKTYFDVLFRAPGSNVDLEAFNWQLGPTGNHTVSADAPLGTWTLTGVRFHENVNDHFSGSYVPISVQLSVGP